MKYRSLLTAGVIAAAGALITACSSSAGAGSPSPAAPAEPETVAGATAAAQRYFGLYSAQQYPAAWALLAPSVQRAVPEATWAAVHAACPSKSAGLGYDVKNVIVTGNTAVATVTLAGALSNLVSGSEAFTYASGRWEYVPDETDVAMYEHGSVTADVAAARAEGLCTT